MSAGGRGAEAAQRRAEALARLFQRPIFIAGRGRSGTTLLLRLFDGHPELFLLPGESRIFTEIAPRLRQSGDVGAAAAELARRYPLRQDDGLAEQLKRLDLADPALPRELLRIALERRSRRSDPAGAVAFLEKTPKNEEHLDGLFSCFPTARVIYVVRDPRAVYVSNRRSETFTVDPGFSAAQWAKSVRRLAPQSLDPERRAQIRVQRFEELVADPRAALERLCAFLGLGWSETLMTPTTRGRPWGGNSYDPALRTPDGVAAAKADAWRLEISAEEEAQICTVAGFEMSLLGYREGL